MIIVRNTPLYYASLESDLADEVLLPRKVDNELVRRGIIKHSRLPHIPLYDTPMHAVSALGPGLLRKTIYIYQPRRVPTDSLVRPDITESPLRDILGEYWSLTGITLQLVMTVVVDRVLEVVNHTFYNPRPTQWKEHIWAYHRLDVDAKKTSKVFYIGKASDSETISLMPGTKIERIRPEVNGFKPVGKVLVGVDNRLKEKAIFKRL